MHLCHQSVLLWFGVCHLHYLFVTCCVLSHPLGLPLYTTGTGCLVYLMCVCVDAIMSVSILHYQHGVNALHLAAAKGHLDVVKYLVPRFGQHTFEKDNAGKTCPHWLLKDKNTTWWSI